MGSCDSTMGLSTTLFVMVFLFFGVASMKNLAYFNETGYLPCHFTNSQNISLGELVVFWQNQDKLVLYEFYRGKENPENVDPDYKGRTSLDKDNWTLRLHNVQIKDKGLYQCFVHHKGASGLVSLHQMNIDLSVLGAKPTEPPLPALEPVVTASVLIPLIIFLCGIVFCVRLKKRKKQQPGPAHGREAIKAEGEESKQTEERVENRVPERSDEAQCVVNSLKMASSDRSAAHF
ncbi:T-lymphocyte activation antigen CD86 isoform X7 [Artibeus jamaicensis]|uniref:T-lymphocyte activation antigen CD86 isoform X7 n=1 Tax=Artibeus jamaicensis TaxID=9417 RepID=UPI00235A9425|nr:T-lymphocyte activation antigen CD86 isoform X7 [Artibeus jamaicensis]